MYVPELRALHHHQSQAAAPGGVSPRPERQRMRNDAAEFAARGPSTSVSVNLECELREAGLGSLSANEALETLSFVGSLHEHANPEWKVRVSAVDVCDYGFCAMGDRAGRLMIAETPSMELRACTGAYVAVIDPLKSVEVAASVNSVAFMPRVAPTPLVLCSNEKVPKLYKLIVARDCPQPFRATDVIGSSRVGPLTLPRNTYGLKHVTTFAMEHEYRIHSVLPLRDGQRLISVDDVEAKLWCAEYSDVPLDVVSIKPAGEQEPADTFLSAATSPHDPVLIFVTTYSGSVHVFDIRQRLRWSAQDGLRLRNDVDPDKPPCVISSAHGPCGHLVAGRDATAILMWDARKPNAVLHRSEIQPLDELALQGRVDVRFTPGGKYVLSGTTRSAIARVNAAALEEGPRFALLEGGAKRSSFVDPSELAAMDCPPNNVFALTEIRSDHMVVADADGAVCFSCS